MPSIQKHFLIMKILSLVSALVILFFLDFVIKTNILFSKFGILVILLVWLLIYITISVGIFLHEKYNTNKI